MKKIVFGSVIVIVFVIALLGGYYGFQFYQSSTYNDLLNKSDTNFMQAKGNLSQVNITKNSYDTNIKYAQTSINLTDEAINQTQQMINTSPDNITYAYAQIRLAQYKNARQNEEYVLKILEDLKSSGIFAAAAFIQNSTQEMDQINKNITAQQNQLNNLINSNPQLKERLINVLGQERVNQILSPAPTPGSGTGSLVASTNSIT